MSVFAPTKAEAARKLRQLQDRLERGLPATDGRTTVATYLPRWLEAVRYRAGPATFRRHEVVVRRQLLPHLGTTQLVALQPRDIAAMLARLQADGLARGRWRSPGQSCARR